MEKRVFILDDEYVRTFKIVNLPETLETKIMKIKIKTENGIVEATAEVIDGAIVVSPKIKKFEPKDMDIVTDDSGAHIFICEKYLGNCAVQAHFGYNTTNNHLFDAGEWSATRYATEEEKKLLFEKLKKEGLEWDADKKEVVKLKWKPKLEEPYYSTYYSNTDYKFVPCERIHTGHPSNLYTIEKGGCFKTKSECQSYCDVLNQSINSIKP